MKFNEFENEYREIKQGINRSSNIFIALLVGWIIAMVMVQMWFSLSNTVFAIGVGLGASLSFLASYQFIRAIRSRNNNFRCPGCQRRMYGNRGRTALVILESGRCPGCSCQVIEDLPKR